MNFQPILQRTHAYLCADCGKCTGSCPLARVDPAYSPRRIVERVIHGDAATVVTDPQLWDCMTCGLCSTRCPSSVDFQRFIIEMRAVAYRTSERGVYAHDGILQEIMRLQTMNVHQNRTGWIGDELRTSDDDEYLYFVGCLPYYDLIFADLGVQAIDIARNAVRLLNRAGIAPMVSNEERCCGADLLLAGDVDSFRKLAELNVHMIEASGAKKVVFTCAECYNAFKNDYPTYVGPLPFETAHLTELLAEELEAGGLAFEPLSARVTYHDPCRMGRFLKVYEPPRAVLAAVPGLELSEMEDNRERAICCGSTGWINCGPSAKAIQKEKMRQARETGASVMLTTCPKCQIHLSCASRDLDAGQKIEVMDLTSWIGQALG
ncbi:MAG: (Fe-S)-binding protein [Anaerolineae bacterium]|jgi:heterodisulfide reductase subunit D